MASAAKALSKTLSWTLSAALVCSMLPASAVEAVAQNISASAGAVAGPVPGQGVAPVPSLGVSQSLGGLSQGLGSISTPLTSSIPTIQSAPAAKSAPAATLSAPAATVVSQAAPSAVSPAVAKSAPAAVAVSPAVAQVAPAAKAVSRVSPSAVSPSVARSVSATSSLSLPRSLARSVSAAAQQEASPDSKPQALASLQQAKASLEKTGSSADATLSALYHGTRTPGDASVAPAADAVTARGFKGPAGRSGLAKRSAVKIAAAAVAIAVPVAAIVGAPVASSVVGAGLLSHLLSLVGQAGYWVANGMSFYMALPQVYQAAHKGTSSSMPLGRAMLMVGASFALGLINAPVAHSMLWGTQNLFGALIMLSTIPIGKWLEKRGKGGLGLSKPADPSWSRGKLLLHRLLHDRALHATLAAAALAAPLCIALYSAAAAFVPGFLASSLPVTQDGTQTLMSLPVLAVSVGLGQAVFKAVSSRLKSSALSDRTKTALRALTALGVIAAEMAAAALIPPLFFPLSVAKVALLVQAATGLMFLMMFLPDALAALKGKPSKSFTPGFSLSFFIGSLAFIVWALQTASQQAAYSPTWWQFMVYTAINAVYAVVAFVSYRVAVKDAKKQS